MNGNDLFFSSLFFIKTKDEKLPVFVCLFLFSIYRKNRKLLATLVIFSFFLLKWNYGKLGDRYAIFLFFHFLNTIEKCFFHFPVFLFFGENGKIEK